MEIFSPKEYFLQFPDIASISLYPYPFLPAYHHFENGLGYKTAFIQNDDGVVIPVRFYKKYYFNFLQIMFPPIKNGNRIESEEEIKFVTSMLLFCKQRNLCDRITQPFLTDIFTGTPDNVVNCSFGIYSINLLDKEEVIFNNFQANYRNEIRKAEQEKITIKYGTQELETFFTIYQNTHQRQGKSFDSWKHIQDFYSTLTELNILCGIVYYREKPQGGILVPFTNYAGYYYYGGSIEKPQLAGAIKALHWDVMKKLKYKGVKKYILGGARLSDISGTKYEGIQNFKARFGSELTIGYLWKQDINPLYAHSYDMLLNLWSHLRGFKLSSDIIDMENQK